MLLVDTHVLIWLDLRQSSLGRAAQAACDEASAAGAFGVSAITFWEVSLLIARKRFELDVEVAAWRAELLANGLTELPINGRIGICAAEHRNLHADPADRLIVATALAHGARLLTADQRILAWPGDLDRQDARL